MLVQPGGILGGAEVADEEGVALRRAQDLVGVTVGEVEHVIDYEEL